MNLYFNYMLNGWFGSTMTEMFHGFFYREEKAVLNIIVIDTLIYYGTKKLY